MERLEHVAVIERHPYLRVGGRSKYASRVDMRVGAETVLLEEWVAGRKAFSARLVDAELQGA